MAVLLLVPAQGLAAKRNWHLGDRTLRQGDQGHDVKVLQNFLTRAGLRITQDGVFGPGTTKAVKAFEASQKRTVDGKFSHLDVLVLRDVVTNGGAVAKAALTGGALPMNAPKPPPLPPIVPPAPTFGPGMKATVGADGLAVIPALAPPAIQQVIAAGNKIAKLPYIYGGGHGKWEDTGYDCSGSVSYALHGGGLLATPMASGNFENWGDAGPGQWITLYANGGHIFAVIAGLRFDTSGQSSAGTRWQTPMRPSKGYVVRHPVGW
ncbi:MAG TPA: peptidoglycan-binding domain-containing protein [Solirubrobacteraceae bacterium]